MKSAYTREERLQAVEQAAIHGIKAAGLALGVSPRTVQEWCYRQFRKEYNEFRGGKLTEWRKSFAAEMEDLQQRYAAVEQRALDEAERMLEDPNIDARDVASLIKGMGAARASATGTAIRARGEPDKIEEHRLNFPAIEAAAEAILAKYGPPPAIEGHAEEIGAGSKT